MSAQTTTYLPALDGLRAISVAIVVLAHYGLGQVIPGGLGVTIFFFISGFIITRLLAQELASSGTISLRNFYLRRLLRLAPALLVYIALSCLFLRAAGLPLRPTDVAAAILYSANYYGIYVGFAQQEGLLSPFGILWSLAIEEHFYLVFPWLLAPLYRWGRRGIGVVMFAIVVILLWRVWLVYGVGAQHLPGYRIYMATDTRADSLLFGALLALGLARVESTALIAVCTGRAATAVACLLLAGSLLIRDETFKESLRYSLQGTALFALVGALLFSDRCVALRRLLSHRAVLYIGKISYSLYLYHWLARCIADRVAGPAPGIRWLAVAVPLAALGAVASYELVERFFLALRERYRFNSAPQPAPRASAADEPYAIPAAQAE